jgi:biopolymer transport protein ExbB/TolQ
MTDTKEEKNEEGMTEPEPSPKQRDANSTPDKASFLAGTLNRLRQGFKSLDFNLGEKNEGLGKRALSMVRETCRFRRGKDPYTEELLHLWPRTLCYAFFWTCLSFFLINSWYLDEIEDTIEDGDLGWEEFMGDEDGGVGLSEFAKEKLDLTISPELDDYLVPCVPPDDPHSFSALEQFTSVYCRVLGEDKKEAVASDLAEKLGSEVGWFGRWMPCGEKINKYGSAKAIIEALNEDSNWKKSLGENEKLKDMEKEIGVFHESLITSLMDEIQSDKRALIRFCGGWIQWVIFFVGYVILILCLRRRRMVKAHHLDDPQQAFYGDKGYFASILQSSQLAREEGLSRSSIEDRMNKRIETLEDNVEEKCYSGLFFLIGMLPSLGFIGTLLGIGSALTRTNALFAAEGKAGRQEAINDITYHLGIAFDTTLVALLGAMLVGFLVHKTRLAELAMIKDFALFLEKATTEDDSRQSSRGKA